MQTELVARMRSAALAGSSRREDATLGGRDCKVEGFLTSLYYSSWVLSSLS